VSFNETHPGVNSNENPIQTDSGRAPKPLFSCQRFKGQAVFERVTIRLKRSDFSGQGGPTLYETDSIDIQPCA
jgi:hypothetical protein